MNEKWKPLETIPLMISPEILKGLLEANDIPVLISRESAANAIGITISPMGDAEILVPESKHDDAVKILSDLAKTDEF